MNAPGYIKAVHPEHGEDVVYVAGEMLPGWVVEALEAGRGQLDEATGVMTIDDSAPKRKGRGNAD